MFSPTRSVVDGHTDAFTTTTPGPPDSPSTPTPLPMTSVGLATLESTARASLAQVALDREATFARALTFMHTCHTSLYTALDQLRTLQGEKDRNEECLVGAEMEVSSKTELLTRTEETRRFLVNRVRCAAWEKKSHFHLTALDHMLGNIQPALFDVASMLRGHLAICAMARSAMKAQSSLQTQIASQLDSKETSFKRVKTLREEIDALSGRTEEYKEILRDIKKRIGQDLERYITKKKKIEKEKQKEIRRQSSTGDTELNPLDQSVTSPLDLSQSITSPITPLKDAHHDESPQVTGFGPLRLSDSSDATSPSANPFLTTNWTSFAPLVASSSSPDSAALVSPTPRSAIASPERVHSSTMNQPLSPPQSIGSFSPLISPGSPDPTLFAPSSKISPTSPPSPMWPISSAPPMAASLLVTSLAAGEAVWPEDLGEIASHHLEQLIHPHHLGLSSHAALEESALGSFISPPTTPPPQVQPTYSDAFGSALPHSSVITSPPRGQYLPSTAGAPAKHEQQPSSRRSASTSAAASSSSSSRSPPTSPTKSSSSGTTTRAGYLNIKMRYFQSLGQVKSGSSPPNSPPPSRTVSSSSAALALTASVAPGQKRWGARKMSGAAADPDTPLPSSPTNVGKGVSSPEAVSPSTASTAPASPTSSPSPSPTTPSTASTAAALAASPPAVRPRAFLARTEATVNKRWMLRPLPANAAPIKPAVDEATLVHDPELTPLRDENIHATAPSSLSSSTSSASSSSSLPTLPDSPSVSTSTSPVTSLPMSTPPTPPKKSWWSSLFSFGSSRPKTASELESEAAKTRAKLQAAAAKEQEKQRKALEKEKAKAAKKGLGLGAGQPTHDTSAASPPCFTPSSPIRVPGSATTVTSPVPSSSVGGSSTTTSSSSAIVPVHQLTEWSSLQELYDEIADHALRQQSAWETLESVLDRRERVLAEERKAAALLAEKEKERQQAQAALAAKSAVAISAVSPAAAAESLSHTTKAPSPLVPSSHALSSSSSVLLGTTNMNTTTSPSGSNHSSSATSSGSTSPPTVAPTAERPARKSVLAVLQSVPAPTLMSTENDPSGNGGEIIVSSNSSIQIPVSLRPLALAIRTAVLQHLSRSLPSTPPAHTAQTSFFGGQHGRRASDSQTRPASSTSSMQHPHTNKTTRDDGGHHSPHSAPATVRSNSFSYDGGHAHGATGATMDDLDDLYAEQRRAYRQHHHSPPSPSSLVF